MNWTFEEEKPFKEVDDDSKIESADLKETIVRKPNDLQQILKCPNCQTNVLNKVE
jgi:hypothetical protein